MLHPTKEYHKGKSRLVFAGQESLNGYQQLAVKFERNKTVGTKLARNPRQLEVRLADRTVYIYGKSSNKNVLLDVPTDLIVSTKRDLNQHLEMGTDMLLFNPIHAPATLDTRPYMRKGIDVLVDSGGFQLAQGTSNFVSPEDTANFYVNQATIGVGLDFPSPPFVDKLLYLQNCELQRLNNLKIRELIPSDVSLAPVIHGSTPLTRMHCLKKVHDASRDKVLALAGLISRRGDSLEAAKQRIQCMSEVLNETRDHILYYHALGATSPWMLALYALLSTTGYVTSIGGDSVSHRQNAIGGSYGLMPHFTGAQSWVQPVESNVSARLPCACPACVAAGDARLLRDFRLSELHHLYVAHANKEAIDANVKSYVVGKISRTELWKFVLGPTASSFRLVPDIAFDHFEAIIAKGFDKVEPLCPKEGFGKRALFGGGSVLSTDQQTIVDRYLEIHKTYEAYHGASLTPKTKGKK